MKFKIFTDTCRRLRTVLSMLVKSEFGPKAVTFFFTLLGLMLLIAGLNVVNSYVGRDFMSSIENKNMGVFREKAVMFVGVLIASTTAAVFYRFAEERLGLVWREQLTRQLTDTYLSDRTYYRLLFSPDVANPDQRIADDVRAFTTTTLSFILLILNGTFTAVTFSGVLWSISPFLFCVAVTYAACGSALAIYLGKPLIRLNYNQLDLEANFRSDLIHVRENAELIALAHREGRFKIRLRRSFGSLTGNFRRIIRINRNLGFFTTGYNYFIQIIPALIIAPLFIHGHIEFGVITQSSMAFATLLGAFSLIVTQFQSISTFTAVTARLYLLSQAMENAHQATTCPILLEEGSKGVSYQNVTLESPDHSHVVIRNLTMEVLPGERWVVTSEDSAAMIALFRATASIGESGKGKISRPGLDDILFLPERPYLPLGTLREVLLRTGKEKVVANALILSVLKKLHLEGIVERAHGLDTPQDWADLLSISEQHMVSIARLLLAQPRIVFLDRPGSSLPDSQISAILDLLSTAGVGVVVLAKNGDAHLRYDAQLEIKPDGSWLIGKADKTIEMLDLTC